MDRILGAIKQASVDAVEGGKPAAVLFGRVESAEPLRVRVEQKLLLEAAQLALSRNVTDYVVEMTVDHETEETAVADGHSHRHPYRGRKEFLVHGALKEGEEVILLRMQGGQRFVVLDRVGLCG